MINTNRNLTKKSLEAWEFIKLNKDSVIEVASIYLGVISIMFSIITIVLLLGGLK